MEARIAKEEKESREAAQRGELPPAMKRLIAGQVQSALAAEKRKDRAKSLGGDKNQTPQPTNNGTTQKRASKQSRGKSKGKSKRQPKKRVEESAKAGQSSRLKVGPNTTFRTDSVEPPSTNANTNSNASSKRRSQAQQGRGAGRGRGGRGNRGGSNNAGRGKGGRRN